MTKETKRKYIILVGVTVLISVLALIGSTYAVLKMTVNGTKQVTMTAGILKVDFKDGNFVNLTNAAPTSDSIALKGKPYTFTITNSGNIDAYYHISLEEDSANTLNNKYIKMRLTGDNYDSGVVSVNSLGSGTFEIFKEKKINPTVSATYKLWLWLDENADNSVQGTTYKSKVVVESFDRTQKTGKLATILTKNLGNNGAVDTTDTDETFITGTDPNNYVWYSGKLWRAMAINTSDSSVKLITQWAVSTLAYSGVLDSPVYGDSYIRSWLNDTSEDGFLGNLRNYNNFIETDSVWNATAILQSENTAKPPKTTLITDSVGLISSYEYAMTYKGATPETGYLNDGLNWWTISPMATSSGSSTDIRCNTVLESGKHGAFYNHAVYGVRPVVNLKSTVKIVDGDGSLDNPYRLENDNDVPESGTKLSTRYSGEYVKFGSDSKSLYRIVSHEFGGTKIVSDVPIGELGNAPFDNSGGTSFSDSVVKLYCLDDVFASSYLTADQKNMVESATWYLGTVGSTDSYLNAKYSDLANSTLTTTVYNGNYGLLRYGELMSGQFDRGTNNSSYWTLTPLESGKVRTVDSTIATGGSINAPTDQLAIKPAMNLKSSVVIVSGDGTKNNPFIVSLG